MAALWRSPRSFGITTSSWSWPTGPLRGIFNPSGHGAALFAFFVGMAESGREYFVGEKSLEGQASAGERGRHGRRPKVFENDMIAYARTLRARGVAVPGTARKPVIPTGENKGRRPSVTSVYRVLADEPATAPAAPEVLA